MTADAAAEAAADADRAEAAVKVAARVETRPGWRRTRPDRYDDQGGGMSGGQKAMIGLVAAVVIGLVIAVIALASGGDDSTATLDDLHDRPRLRPRARPRRATSTHDHDSDELDDDDLHTSRRRHDEHGDAEHLHRLRRRLAVVVE